ncbi:MAG: DNA polymerase II small subunit, partial [Thermoproteota archaeon]
MKKDVVFALNYALNKGFQIHPNAFEILEKVEIRDLEKVIRDIVREKTKQKVFHINQEDLEVFLGLKEEEELLSEHKILSDPTLKITSSEGIIGFGALFSNRFSRLKRMVSNRPEAKLLKPISSIIASKSDNDVFVCGLLVERNSERSVTKLIIDDPTGSLESIVFDKDLQNIANSLLIDQFVMERVSLGKNGGFIVKDIIVPNIPDHTPNYSKTETYAVF